MLRERPGKINQTGTGPEDKPTQASAVPLLLFRYFLWLLVVLVLRPTFCFLEGRPLKYV